MKTKTKPAKLSATARAKAVKAVLSKRPASKTATSKAKPAKPAPGVNHPAKAKAGDGFALEAVPTKAAAEASDAVGGGGAGGKL